MVQTQLSSPRHHVCPWWLAYTFDNPIRKLFHNPHKIFGAYVKEGMTVIDVGCGMGYFSIGMAKLVGASGKVIALDLQQKMLDVMLRRARRAGVADRISPHRCEAGSIGILEPVDFILAFWMVHEVSDKNQFFQQLRSNLAVTGKVLIAEPNLHVTAEELEKTIEIAQDSGLRYCDGPKIRFSRTALFSLEIHSSNKIISSQ
ncbi:MAG: class I SAM-dependent methyltransferase [Desulfobacterales bacterium]|nr:MAG: class I SAM-dependent methyltransferase [Desulfobacterales bacterium]